MREGVEKSATILLARRAPILALALLAVRAALLACVAPAVPRTVRGAGASEAHRDRKLMRLFHPDNYTNAAAEVRTKMVEAYRLVSESRPDA